MNKKEKVVAHAIGKILMENPNLTMKDLIWGFTDFLGMSCVDSPDLFPYYQECLFKWIAYYVKCKDVVFKEPE